MKAINFLGATNIIGESQGYQPLPIIVHKGEDFVTITSIWEPSIEEIKLLTMGHKVQLTILGLQQPPVRVEVTKVPERGIAMPINNKVQ